jgi:hypothetical protein
MVTDSCLGVITDSAEDRGVGELDLEWPMMATLATGGSFQHPVLLCDIA